MLQQPENHEGCRGCGDSRRTLNHGICRAGADACPRPPRDAGTPMNSLLTIILLVARLYIYVLIAAAVLSWLIAFNVVNTRNQFVAMLADALWKLTEPVLRPIRNILPNLGGLDLSPVVVILVLIFIMNLIGRYQYGLPL
jgi:YggT family protein